MHSQTGILFYDGDCGLCHRSVTLAIRKDRQQMYRYSPLKGETIKTLLSEQERSTLPDSVVLRLDDGTILMRSSAVAYMLQSFGGFYRVLGTMLFLVPRFLRDFLYDVIARMRLRFFKKPDDACPIVSKELRERFLP